MRVFAPSMNLGIDFYLSSSLSNLLTSSLTNPLTSSLTNLLTSSLTNPITSSLTNLLTHLCLKEQELHRGNGRQPLAQARVVEQHKQNHDRLDKPYRVCLKEVLHLVQGKAIRWKAVSCMLGCMAPQH